MVIPAVKPLTYKAFESSIFELAPESRQIVKTHLVYHKADHQARRILKGWDIAGGRSFANRYLCLKAEYAEEYQEKQRSRWDVLDLHKNELSIKITD